MKKKQNDSLFLAQRDFVIKPLIAAVIGVLTVSAGAVEVNTNLSVDPDAWQAHKEIDRRDHYYNKDVWFGYYEQINDKDWRNNGYQGKKFETYTDYQGGAVNHETNITLAHKAKVLVANDAITRVLGFGQTTFDPSYIPGGIAFGTYRKTRAGSVLIGTAQFIWNSSKRTALGDIWNLAEWDNTYQKVIKPEVLGLAVTQLGTNSFQQGHFSTMLGAYSLDSSLQAGFQGDVGMFSILNGSFNSNENYNSKKNQSGVLNQLNGSVNIVSRSNGVSIQGTGNKVEGSYEELPEYSTLLTKEASTENAPYYHVTDLQNAAQSAIQKNSGKDIQLSGNGNSVNNAELLTVMGSLNTVANSANGIFVGDHYNVSGSNNVVMLGGNDTKPTTATKLDGAVVIGRNAQVNHANGVVIGPNAVNEENNSLVLGSDSHSVALSEQQTPGWHSTTRRAWTDTSKTWKPTQAGVSIGDVTKDVTRQMQGVAAGADDDDLANVAQLKLAARTLSVNGGTDFSDTRNGPSTGKSNGNLKLTAKRVPSGTYQGITHVDMTLSDDLSLNNGAVSISGTQSQMVVGTDEKAIGLDGTKGDLKLGDIKLSASDNTLTGLKNTAWPANNFKADRMATEGQLKAIDDRQLDADRRLTTIESKIASTTPGLDGQLNSIQNDVNSLNSSIATASTDVKNLEDKINVKDVALSNEHWVAKASKKDGSKGVLDVKSTSNSDASKDNQIYRNEALELVAGNNMTLSLSKTGTEVGYVLGVSKNLKGIKKLEVAKGVSLALSDDGSTIALDGTQDQGRLDSPAGAVATLKDGQAYATDVGRGTGTLNHAMQITGGVSDANQLTTGNIGVKVKDGGFSIELAQNLDLTENGSVKVGEIRLGKDASDKAVLTGLKNTKDLTGDDSAVVTEGQLAALMGNSIAVDQGAAELRRQLNDLDVDMRDMGATAAAMAALKPVSFDPKKPSQVMLGAGAYRGREAIAMGLGHYINESLFVNAGLAVGRAKMANVGVTFSFGGPKKAPEMTQAQVSTALQQMSVRLDQLKSENDALDETNRRLDARNKTLSDTHQRLVKQQQRLQAMSSIIYRRLQALMAAQ